MPSLTPKQRGKIRFLLRTQPDATRAALNGRIIESLSKQDASAIITAVEGTNPNVPVQPTPEPVNEPVSPEPQQNAPQNNSPRVNASHNYRAGSLRARVANALIECNVDREATFAKLLPDVQSQSLVFKGNPPPERKGGPREPLPIGDNRDDQGTQIERLWITINEVASKLTIEKIPVTDPEPDPEPEPEPPAPVRSGMTPEQYLRKLRELRRFCEDRAADGNPLDEIGVRPAEFGAQMYAAGIPFEAALYALTQHWPADIRRQQNIEDFDYAEVAGPKIKGKHPVFGYVVKLAQARVPIALWGPKGTGKTTLAKQLADHLAVDFGMVSMTGGTSPSALTGKDRLREFVPSKFSRIYTQGGVFLFDEMDAADENLLILVNSALANGFFDNPATGEREDRHENFIPVACMNTMGLGANRHYTGRSRLDAATLDRWNMGRVNLTISEPLESEIFAMALERQPRFNGTGE